MRARHVEMGSLVVDIAHSIAHRVYTGLYVGHNGVTTPTPFPQLVQDLHVFFSNLVPSVVRDLFGKAEVASCTVKLNICQSR
jgi:hypothetical protein